MEAVHTPGDAHRGTTDRRGALLGAWCVLGSWHRAACFRNACAEVCLEDAARWPLRNGTWWVPHWAMTFICVEVMYTMVMVAPARRRVSTSPAECRWTSVYVVTSGPC